MTKAQMAVQIDHKYILSLQHELNQLGDLCNRSPQMMQDTGAHFTPTLIL